MSVLGQWFYDAAKQDMERALAELAPYTATVVTVGATYVTITNPITGSTDSTQYAVIGPKPVTGERVVILPLTQYSAVALRLAHTGPLADPKILYPAGLQVTDNVSVTAITSGNAFFEYLGRADKSSNTVIIYHEVTTAAVTITQAELGIFKGPHPTGATSAADLTRLVVASQAAVWNSTGAKTVSISGAGIVAGDDLWLAYGAAASTMPQFKAGMGDNIRTGVQRLAAAYQLSSGASPVTTARAAAGVNRIWAGVKLV